MRSTIILAALAFSASAASAETPRIVEYYNWLAATSFRSNYEYRIKADGAGWRAVSDMFDANVSALVDGRNGYLLIDDEGTGGGNFRTEAAYWNTDGYGILLGIGETSFDGQVPDATRLRIFSRQDDAWMEEGGLAWPLLGVVDFMPDDLRVGDVHLLERLGAAIYITLPRHGLNADAWLVVRHVDLLGGCATLMQDKTVSVDIRRYCEVLAPYLFSNVTMEFSKAEARFIRSRQSRQTPPWQR